MYKWTLTGHKWTYLFCGKDSVSSKKIKYSLFVAILFRRLFLQNYFVSHSNPESPVLSGLQSYTLWSTVLYSLVYSRLLFSIKTLRSSKNLISDLGFKNLIIVNMKGTLLPACHVKPPPRHLQQQQQQFGVSSSFVSQS